MNISISRNANEIRGAIKKAFSSLRKNGFFARMNFSCCCSCASCEIPKGQENYVFYHRQGNECLEEYGELYLYWGGEGSKIVDALHEQKLIIKWNGSEARSIKIEGVYN